MGSTERDRSIGSSSMFIPNWVKNKFDNSGFDPSTLSPPTNDGEFFYVKLPRADKVNSIQISNKEHSDHAFDNHTTSKKFIPKKQNSVVMMNPSLIKSLGMGDRTHSDEVSSSPTVAAVAQQIAAGTNTPVRGFTTDDANGELNATHFRQRRNSKSLPASPLMSPESSPRTRRKNVTAFALQNRFITGQLDGSLNESDENLAKKSGSSWILSQLFSNTKDGTVVPIKNEQNVVAAEGSNLTDGSSKTNDLTNVNLLVEVKPTDVNAPSLPDRTTVYRKKRSEIRELNFISPVSM